MSEATISWITCANREEAEKIADALVGEKIAACVNVIPGVTSVFSWEGKICREEEILLMVKSVPGMGGKLVDRVKSLHSYTVPEVITIPIASGNPAYLDWVVESTSGK